MEFIFLTECLNARTVLYGHFKNCIPVIDLIASIPAGLMLALTFNTMMVYSIDFIITKY